MHGRENWVTDCDSDSRYSQAWRNEKRWARFLKSEGNSFHMPPLYLDVDLDLDVDVDMDPVRAGKPR